MKLQPRGPQPSPLRRLAQPRHVHRSSADKERVFGMVCFPSIVSANTMGSFTQSAPSRVCRTADVSLPCIRTIMNIRAIVSAVTLLAALSHLPANAQDQPVPAKDAPSRMTLPEGFGATPFAGEVVGVWPTAFTDDASGA